VRGRLRNVDFLILIVVVVSTESFFARGILIIISRFVGNGFSLEVGTPAMRKKSVEWPEKIGK